MVKIKTDTKKVMEEIIEVKKEALKNIGYVRQLCDK